MSDVSAETPSDPEDQETIDPRSVGEKIREMVKAEAAAMEAETVEEPDEPDPEDEPEKAIDPLTAALIAYIGSVQEILGPGVPIHPCPYCQGKGFEPMTLNKDPHSEVCSECDGYGRVATGSFVSGNETRMCVHCSGAGYVPERAVTILGDDTTPFEPVRVLTPEEVERIAADARTRVGIEGA